MNKIILFLIAIFIASTLTAQNLTISDLQGNDISNSTVTYDVHPSVDTESHEFHVANTSDMDISVNAKRYENECVEGSGEFFCWSLCLPSKVCGSDYVRNMPYAHTVNANSPSTLPLLTDFEPSFSSDEDGLEGISSYTYVLFDDNNPNDSVYITIIYNVDYAVGVEEFSSDMVSEVYPNPAGDEIRVTVDVNIPLAQFEIYSMVGKLVKRVDVENAHGRVSIDVSDLLPGIYFLTETKTAATRRFIISR